MAEAYGFTDEAALEDKFGIADYIGGLAKFIEKCNTPMTISIQGSWGTGKTSIMNLVKNELSKDVVPIWFNTWQYSQFNMDDQLAVSLLSSLIAEFHLEDTETVKETNKLIKALKFTVGVSKDLALAYIDAKVGGRFADMTENAGKKAAEAGEAESQNGEYVDPTSAIRRLRDQFALCVEKTLKNKSRIVIFIDDLDRLEPRKAVELLEVLKIFLDCKNCVFVLAIDYDVVQRGVIAKYGALDNDLKQSAEKGRSFFDKIIQVPFKMPVARYDISGYVESCFGQIGLHFSDEELANYVDLIKRSIGANPRSMKRLFNSYQLLMLVVPDKLLRESKNQQLLFAILCLQYCNENIYNFMIRNSDELTGEMFNAIVEGHYTEFTGMTEDVEGITEDDLTAAQPFMEKFRAAVDADGKNGIDDKELANFIQVMKFSAITSAADTETTTKRGSLIVSDVDDLTMPYMTREQKEHVISLMRSIGEDVTIQLVKAKYGHIAARIGGANGRTFTDVYDRKNGYNMDIFVPRPDVYTNHDKYPEIAEWIDHSRYKPGKAVGGRRISPVVGYNTEEEKDLINFAKKVYQVWKNEVYPDGNSDTEG